MDHQLAEWLSHNSAAGIIFLLLIAVLALASGKVVVPRWTFNDEKARVAALEAELELARREADGLRERLLRDRAQKKRAVGLVDEAIKDRGRRR